jgi:hypothetical protein
MALVMAAPALGEPAMWHAIGTFTVKMTPAAQNSDAGVALERMSVSKEFSGGLTATGEGEMLTATGAVPESAAYVLIKRVTGS